MGASCPYFLRRRGDPVTKVGAIAGQRRNLELKARDLDPFRSAQVCIDLGAVDKGTLIQRDTYRP